MIEMLLPERDIHEHGEVAGSDYSNRLILFYVKSLGGPGHNFHELVWFRLIARELHPVITISSAQFQSASSLRRWVCELYSFNSDEGTAIIRVGEVDSPDPNYHNAIYTWRLLHLRTLEMRTLQQCSDPFDSYTGG